MKPFLTENEKMEATIPLGLDVTQLFNFIIFFPCQSGIPQAIHNYGRVCAELIVFGLFYFIAEKKP